MNAAEKYEKLLDEKEREILALTDALERIIASPRGSEEHIRIAKKALGLKTYGA